MVFLAKIRNTHTNKSIIALSLLCNNQARTWKYRLHSQWSRSEEMSASIFLNWSSCELGSPLSSGVLNLGQ